MIAALPASVVDVMAPPGPRLLEASRHRLATSHSATPLDEPRLLGLLADGSDPRATLPPPPPGTRLLVIGWLGTHPDARDSRRRMLWALEEAARASGLPTLVLRLAPLVGPRSPLTAVLARQPRLSPRLARALIQPLLETDAVEVLARAWRGEVPWQGVHELCGPDIVTVEELREREAQRLDRDPAITPAWEPDPEILSATMLAEPDVWAHAFGMAPARPWSVS